MRLQINPVFPRNLDQLARQLSSLWREVAQQVNGVSEGQMAAWHNARTAAPTSGKHAAGDFIYNSAPSELGTTGSKYVVHGWQCIAAGEPGTWVECRFLTGN